MIKLTQKKRRNDSQSSYDHASTVPFSINASTSAGEPISNLLKAKTWTIKNKGNSLPGTNGAIGTGNSRRPEGYLSYAVEKNRGVVSAAIQR